MNNCEQKRIKIISSDDQKVFCSNGIEYMDVSFQNFQKICRFCLFGPAEVNMFRNEQDNTSLLNICQSQFSIRINPSDGLPENICTKCNLKIKDFQCFRTLILDAEHVFKEILTRVEARVEATEFVSNNALDDRIKNVKQRKENNNAKPPKHKFKCKYCKEIFNTSSEYKKHLKEERENRKDVYLACPVCKKLYTKRKLELHARIHSETNQQKIFQCDICRKSYSTKRNLSRHHLSHTGMPHVCEVCGKGFREANLLKDHQNIHSGISPYLCNHCGKSYPSSSALRLHRNYTHTGKTRKNYKYPKKNENRTIKKTVNKGSFPCEICGKVYASRTIVNYHVLTHSDQKKFQCNDCGKMFANRGILGDHRRIHRLSYKCTYCERSFAYAASLETHINSHTGEKPHCCTACGKRYSNRSHLKEHMRNHTGERPYSCTICGKTFAVKGNLNAHLKTHTKQVLAS